MKSSEHDTNNNNIHTFNEWVNAFRAHDIPRMVSLLTDDVRIISIIFGTYKSKDGASKYWQELYDVFPDININPVTITVDLQRICSRNSCQWNAEGKVCWFAGFRKQL